jgi:hypothetical protein
MRSTEPGARSRARTWLTPRRLAVGSIVLLALLALLVGTSRGRSWGHRVAHVARVVTGIDEGTPRVIDDVSVKADMIEGLSTPPQLIILGGSRGLRIEPAYLKQKTGLETFHAGVPNERSEEAWALTHFIHERFPNVRPRYLWPIHVKFLRAWQHVTPSLVLDPRLNRYFDAAFLDAQRAALPRKFKVGDRTLRLTDPARYAPDGRMIKERDWDQARIERLIDQYTRRWITKFGPGSPTIDDDERLYFEKTLGYMNELGAAPVIVLMPLHPRHYHAVAHRGWLEARDDLMTYFDSLAGSYDFSVVDLSRVESFGGDPDGFYDAYHPRVENTRRIVDEILRRYPHAFD